MYDCVRIQALKMNRIEVNQYKPQFTNKFCKCTQVLRWLQSLQKKVRAVLFFCCNFVIIAFKCKTGFTYGQAQNKKTTKNIDKK